MVTMLRLSFVTLVGVLLLSCTQDNVRSRPVSVPTVISPAELAKIPVPVARAEARSKYGNPPSYEVFGQRYEVLSTARGYVETGRASWYGPGFHEKLTSTRERYDMYAMTAAHKTLPIPCFVEVTNLENGRRIVVRVNDRGPFVAGRIIDLSYVAAQKLDIIDAGTAAVRVVALTTPTNQVVNYEKLPGSPALARQPENPQVSNYPSSPTAQYTPRAPVASGIDDVLEAPAKYAVLEQPIFLQLGAFANQDNALALQEKLGLELEPEYVVMVFSDATNGRLLHRVQVGPLANLTTAQHTKDRLRQLGYQDVEIIGKEE